MNPLFKLSLVSGNVQAAKMLIQRGADLDKADKKGMSPLMYAAEKGHLQVCRLLLEYGADASWVNANGRDAIWYAKQEGHHELATLLADHILTTQSEKNIAKSEFYCFPSDGAHADDGEDLGHDFSSWEVEVNSPPPVEDQTCLPDALKASVRIRSHSPIDTDEGWSDVDVDLPDLDTLAVLHRTSTRTRDWQKIRQLFLIGLISGRVSQDHVLGILANSRPAAVEVEPDIEDSDDEFSRHLLFILEELGVRVEEWSFDPISLDQDRGDDYEEEEALATEAIVRLATIDATQDLDLWWHHYKAIGRFRLLSAEDEQELGREIEEGLCKASIALAECPKGVKAMLATVDEMIEGRIKLNEIIDGSISNSNMLELSMEEDEEIDPDDEEHLSWNSSCANQAEEFLSQMEIVRQLHNKIANQFVDGVNCKHWSYAPKDGIKESLSRFKFNSIFYKKMLETIMPCKGMRDDIHEEVNKRRHSAALNSLKVMCSAIETNSLKTFPDSPKQEWCPIPRLMEGFQQVINARRKMIEANYRLVAHVVRHSFRSGMDLMDLIQEGTIGLMKAVDRFDHRKGFRFATYASHWIRQAIRRAIANQSRIIRLPVHVHDKYIRMIQVIREQEERKQLNEEEISKKTGLSVSVIHRMMAYPVTALPIQYSPDEEDDDSTLLLPDESISSPEALAMETARSQALEQVLESLESREANILRLRFGLGPNEEHTLEEIGLMYGVTRERIRQIEAKAISKMTHPSREIILKDFLN